MLSFSSIFVGNLLTLSEVYFVWRAVQNLYFSQCLYNTMNRQKGTFHIYNYIFTLLSKYNKKQNQYLFQLYIIVRRYEFVFWCSKIVPEVGVIALLFNWLVKLQFLYMSWFFSDLWQVDGFLLVVRFPVPIKLTATI